MLDSFSSSAMASTTTRQNCSHTGLFSENMAAMHSIAVVWADRIRMAGRIASCKPDSAILVRVSIDESQKRTSTRRHLTIRVDSPGVCTSGTTGASCLFFFLLCEWLSGFTDVSGLIFSKQSAMS